jgi:hypothetical protein
MQFARLADLFQFAAQFGHAVADQPSVGLDLRFAGAAQEAEAAALPFKVGPAPHQAALLIVEMRQFDLQASFCCRCPFAEDFEDQPGAVDDLALQPVFEIALLDRRQCAIDDDEIGFVQFAIGLNALDLPFTEQRVRPYSANRQDVGFDNDDSDGESKAFCLFQSRFGILVGTLPPDVRAQDKGPRTAGNLALYLIIIEDQSSSPSSSKSPLRSTCVAG